MSDVAIERTGLSGKFTSEITSDLRCQEVKDQSLVFARDLAIYAEQSSE